MQEWQQTKTSGRVSNENILDADCKQPGREQLISSVNMIGFGQNEGDLSEVERQTDAPYSKTDDFGIIKTHLIDKRVKLV